MKKLVVAAVAVISMVSFAFTNAAKDEHVTLIISHEVKDFDIWKKGFDADEVNRTKGGFKFVALYRSVQNPNVITTILDAPSAEVVQGFLGNPELKVTMEKAGVISAPDIKVLNKVQ